MNVKVAICKNAVPGVRAVDLREPYHPQEVGYYIPATNANTEASCVKTAEGPRYPYKMIE